MAARLLGAGATVAVWNRTRGRADVLRSIGARRADSPADAASSADIVITMLADPDALRAVLDGTQGVLDALRPGMLLVDCSTVGPEMARIVAGQCRERGATFVDAPVLGSVPSAEQGTLTILAGGASVDIDRAHPVLALFGRTVVRTGDAGSASALKLVMNLLIGGQTELMAEAFLLAERAGLDKDVVKDALTGSVLNSPFVGYTAPQLLDRTFSPLFTTALLLKDIDLALDLARAHDLALPGVRAVRDAYAASSAHGRTDEDYSAVIATLDVTGDRDGGAGPVTYEVTAIVEPRIAARYEQFMCGTHIREIVRTGCFLHGRFQRTEEGHYRTSYLAASHVEVVRYIETHAPRFSEQLAAAFPDGVSITRAIWSERARWP